MPYFHYSQNNSGGSFDYDEASGITHHVVIEAESAEAADKRLESIGGYFNGCDDGRDCPCCGDRWYPQYGDGDAAPLVYGEPASNVNLLSAWMPEGREIAVHPLNGAVEWYGDAGAPQ